MTTPGTPTPVERQPLLRRVVNVRTITFAVLCLLAGTAIYVAASETYNHRHVTVGAVTIDCGSATDPVNRVLFEVRMDTPTEGELSVVVDACETALDDARSTRSAALTWALVVLVAIVLAGWLLRRPPQPTRRELLEGMRQMQEGRPWIKEGVKPRTTAMMLMVPVTEEITTDRLRLAPIEKTDEAAYFATIDRSVKEANGMTEARLEIDREIIRLGLNLGLLVRERATDRPIGFMSVSLTNTEASTCSLGWWIVPDARGQGYGTEAVAATLDALHRLGYDWVSIETAADNMAVRRVMEKVGAEQIGAGLKRLPNGREVDAVFFVHRSPTATGEDEDQAESEP